MPASPPLQPPASPPLHLRHTSPASPLLHLRRTPPASPPLHASHVAPASHFPCHSARWLRAFHAASVTCLPCCLCYMPSRCLTPPTSPPLCASTARFPLPRMCVTFIVLPGPCRRGEGTSASKRVVAATYLVRPRYMSPVTTSVLVAMARFMFGLLARCGARVCTRG